MAIFKCKMCGGTLEISVGDSVAVCEYCNTKQTLPKLDDDKRAQLYDRANYFRRENEFDKAMGIYEMILSEDKEECESYWGIVLCRYGIEYVEDPRSHKRIPTVNRAQFTSIFEDADYKNAIKYADALQKEVYEAEATVIDKIQKGILAISQKEEPFDVFICYKETDANGNRTQDSVYAQDIYNALTKEGYKVFFSRITLEDKLGSAYEPYIFAALNSAKVMLVVGTTKENFEAVWVKNEWSRFISLIQSGKEKTLIPVYKDISPYQMPEEFQYLQSQDMAKIGFIQDLVRGVQKIIGNEQKTASVQTSAPTTQTTNIAPLLKRAFMFLEDGDFERADEFCEQVLNIDPENVQAYLGKLMAELEVNNREALKDCAAPFDKNNNYQKCIRYGDDDFKNEIEGYIKYINVRNEKARNENIYCKAKRLMGSEGDGSIEKAISLFESIKEYKDSENLLNECKEMIENAHFEVVYRQATDFMGICSLDSLDKAIDLLESVKDYKDSASLIEKCVTLIEKEKKKVLKQEKQIKIVCAIFAILICGIIAVSLISDARKKEEQYNTAVSLMNEGNYDKAIGIFKGIINYRDGSAKIDECYDKAVALLNDGEYKAAMKIFFELDGYMDVDTELRQIHEKLRVRESVSAGCGHTVGLKSDGTVVAVGLNYEGQCDVENWSNIVGVSAGGYHTIGLEADHTVVATGNNDSGQCNVSDWTDIVSISAGNNHTVGLKSDGTVVAVGDNYNGQCNVFDWSDIVAVYAGDFCTVGLRADGTVVAVGLNYEVHFDVINTSNVVSVALGNTHTAALYLNGSVAAFGNNDDGKCVVTKWRDITAISAGTRHTVGLKTDGTVVVATGNSNIQKEVSGWKDIVFVSAKDDHIFGLKADGTLVVAGYDCGNDCGQCDVSDWTNIKIPNTIK